MRVTIFVVILIVLAFPVKAEILEVCPNPYNPQAEYVKVKCNVTCILSDGEGNVTLKAGVHYVTKNSSAFEKEFGFKPDAEFKGRFALANGGDEVLLYENGVLVDKFSYKKSHRGLIYYREGGWKFRYEDWTNFKPVKDYVKGEIIVTPANFVFKADTIVSYTFTTDRYVKGNYTLYLDANPIGGIPINEIEIAKDHKTYFLKSPSYRFFHWKFGLRNDEIVITTENWRWNNIGYIIHFESQKVSKFLRKVLEHDRVYAGDHGNVGKLRAFKSFGGRGKIYKFEGNVTVFVLPDYNPIFDEMKKAKRRLYIMAPYIHFRDTEFLDILRNKSCEVRIITADEDCAEFLKDFGSRNGLKLEVKVDKRVHGKLVIADDEAVITSANFDECGFKMNREIGVILEGKVVGDLASLFNEEDDTVYIIPALILLCLAIAIAYIWLRFR
ncbi:phospholipase D-like domain-containing protein [Archaeoglobus sp.]